MSNRGRIYKGIGGFYYVKTAEGLLECKARGIFRKQGIKPLAGDWVGLGFEAGSVYIDTIEPRKNSFIRPPVANLDQLLIVASACEPAFSPLLVDKMLVCAWFSGAQPLILLTKTDLREAWQEAETYRQAGYRVMTVIAPEASGLGGLCQALQGKLSALCGNSGVGKSSILNALLPEPQRQTGEISRKLGRGRHTTREVEIFEVCGGLIADTPGFASMNLSQVVTFDKAQLQNAFPEIAQHAGECRYADCAHISEDQCAVRAAAQRGEISASRYKSYATFYQEAMENEKY